MFHMTKADLEDEMDFVKVVLLRALVAEGLLNKDCAEEWAKSHSLVLRKKGFFRTLTNLWGKEPEFEHHYLVVRLVKE